MPKPTGARLIAIERTRQIRIKNWTPEYDARHAKGQLGFAGLGYLLAALNKTGKPASEVPVPPPFWPWTVKDFKPAPEPVRNLVKAGALIAAEIDRILREREIERG